MGILFALVSNGFAKPAMVISWDFPVNPDEVILDAVRWENIEVLVTTHRLVGLDPENYEMAWQHEFPRGRFAFFTPIFGDDIAVYTVYRGKGKWKDGESGETQLFAVDLSDGQLLWSAYLPEYIPFATNIAEGRVYLSCERAKKPLKLNKLEQQWKRSFVDRHDAWLVCLNLENGTLLWNNRTDVWSMFLGTYQQDPVFAEYIGEGDAQKTRLVRRDVSTGHPLWYFEDRFDKTDYTFVREHPRGIVAFSHGFNETMTHLVHPETGERMGGEYLPNAGTMAQGDTLRIFGVQETLLYGRKPVLNELLWSQFTPIGSTAIRFENGVSGPDWANGKSVEERLVSEIGYWSFHQDYLQKKHQTVFRYDIDEEQVRVILRTETTFRDSARIQAHRGWIYDVEPTDKGATWIAFLQHGNHEVMWQQEHETKQVPVWMNGQFDGEMYTGFDGSLASVEPRSGAWKQLILPTEKEYTHAVERWDTGVMVVRTDGAKFLQRFVPPSPELEPQVVPEIDVVKYMKAAAETVYVVQVDTTRRVEIPSEKTEPVKVEEKPVVEKPVVEKSEVTVWRVQLMYLKRSNMKRANTLAEKAKDNLGVHVHVIGTEGAIKLQAGDFESKMEATKWWRAIRKRGYRDAFIVKSRVLR